ncbi:hypothetical protein GCM10027589_23360 [Actinocorallia lasiicapitis]
MATVDGTVVAFDNGAGRIAPEKGGREVHVDSAAITEPGVERLEVGQRVRYDIRESTTGTEAANVVLL